MRRLAALLCLALLAPRSSHAGKSDAFPYPMEVHALPNGLRVVLVTYDSPGLAAYYTLMRVGSRNEPEKGRSGYAHFFEHMMFRGTKKHSGEDYNKTVTRLGLDTNAFTSSDETVYHLFGSSKALPTIIELEADRFTNLEYSEAQFRTEAGAILGEYAKSASNPEHKLEEKLMETAFDKSTYRHTTIGYLADVQAMPDGFAYSREFFRRYYTPDNATIVVVGDFEHAQVLAHITRAYADWKGKLDPAPLEDEPPHTEPRTAHVDWPTPTLSRIVVAWNAPGGADVKRAAVQHVLGGYLFGITSPLYQDLVLGRQLVDSIDAGQDVRRDPALFGVLARVKNDKDVGSVQAAVLAQVSALAAGKVDAARLAAVRSHLKYGAIMHLDTAGHVAVSLAVATATTGDLQYLNKLYAAADALKAADLVAFARAYLVDARRTVLTLRGAP